jgi:hypothetical protein
LRYLSYLLVSLPAKPGTRHALSNTFRRTARLHSDDWVLHLDEETQIDAFAVRACLDFI